MEAVQQAAQLDDVIVVGPVWPDVVEDSTESGDGMMDLGVSATHGPGGVGATEGMSHDWVELGVFGFFVRVDLLHEEAVNGVDLGERLRCRDDAEMIGDSS